jgi:hypothetical protein
VRADEVRGVVAAGDMQVKHDPTREALIVNVQRVDHAERD